MIKYGSDLCFLIVTKRIERFVQSIPSDWGEWCNCHTGRITRWSDVKYLYDQCKHYNITFVFERTGSKWVGEGQNRYAFIRGQGKQVEEAEKLNMNYQSGNPDCLQLPMKFDGKNFEIYKSKFYESIQLRMEM